MSKQVALVTGGTGGIGTAICHYLCQKGYQVAAGYNKNGNHDLANAWQAEQKLAGFDITIVYADVTNFDSAGIMVAEVEEVLGPIDVLVNNAGITQDATLRKMDVKQWHDVISTNLDSVFNVSRAVINGMIERAHGRIINISSINGQKGQFGQTNYAASKAGIHGFTKALAQEVARKGITVNTVSPGYVNTDMMSAVPDDVLQGIIAQIPVGRLGEVTEIARVVAFLAAKESGFITGADISINGGQHMC